MKTTLLIPVSLLATLISSVSALTSPAAIAQSSGSVGIEQIKPQEKTRIAVLNFDTATVSQSGLRYGLYDESGASKGISNLLTNELVKEGSYILIERSRVEAVLAEQNFGQSGRVEPSTAAQIGRILGVDAVVIGSITQFHVEEQSRGGSLSGLFGLGGRQQKQVARVQLATRLVSTATGEILASAEGTGEADKSDGGGRIFGIGIDSNSDSSDRLLGEASSQAVGEIVTQLARFSPRLAASATPSPVSQMVIADVTGGMVVLNKGGNHGFRPGMVVSVERVIKEIKDPVTGKFLRQLTEPVGRVQLTQVDPDSSIGKVLSGSGFRVGDIAKAID
ncbi:CsgG/HfaB family protein [Lyngbya confervoides]|uniref:CsgG/HfaB family protein n=1 Tax=Lyngbya confervoides BDU141951 TaxID=1574623 RepID=A0ABD4SYU2_9CYAN|nr:CsgG/HfaB family protein [Lyngbya confervoides]MCM1981586.1 CsgG/HfaB family protein [Lyngbya confervoides BDU141951]